jgi:hypothetical protein
MPLHDWNTPKFWSGVHSLWLSELFRYVKPKLPHGYRAYLGTLPYLAIGVTNGDPDLTVTRTPPGPVHALPGPGPDEGRQPDEIEPDVEALVATLPTPDLTLFVELDGLMVAAVEVVSPRNKDRQDAKAAYAAKYLGYLRQMVNLMVLEVTPRPHGFSFANLIAAELEIPNQPPIAAPVVASYRVIGGVTGEPAVVEVWRRAVRVGDPLPTLPLAIGPQQSISIDLEGTYMRAATDMLTP